MKEEVLHEELLARKSSSLESYWVVVGCFFFFFFLRRVFRLHQVFCESLFLFHSTRSKPFVFLFLFSQAQDVVCLSQ